MATLAESNAFLRKEIRQHRRVQEELESLFNLSIDMLCITGFDGYFKRLNPAFQKCLGYTDEELRLRPFIDFVHPEDRQATLAEFEQILSGLPTISFENRHRHKDGSYRWLAWTAQPVPEKGLIYATARDITEQKWSQRKFQGFLEAAPDAIVIADQNGEIVMVNAQTETMFGYARAELLGTPVEALIPESLRPEHLRHRSAYNAAPKARGISAVLDLYGLRKDGSTFPAEISLSPVTTKDGVLVLSAIRDVTERKLAQEALQESERRYRTLVEHAPEAIVVLDMESGNFVDCNREAERLFGLPREALLQTNPVTMSPEFQPDGRPSGQTAFEEIEKALRGEVPYFEWMHQSAQGLQIPCEIRLVSLPSAGRMLVCGSIMDITERKRAEETLHLTQFMVDSAGDAIFWMHDDARFLNVNEQAYRTLGYTHEELIEMSVLDIGVGMTMEGFRVIWETVKQKKSYTFEAEHRRKDGRTFPVEITANYLEHNDHDYLCAFVRDVTDRKLAEAALQITQFAVDSAADAVFWVHQDAVFSYANKLACESLGYTPEALLTMSVMDITEDHNTEQWAEVWEEVKQCGSYTFEARHRRKDGTVFPVEISANYLEHDDEAYLCAFVRDITERKRAEETLAQKAQALERSNDELQQFAYVASHDLQEPLRTISSYVQLLQKRYQGQLDADADDFIEFIVNAAERMQALIRDLLAYSRVGRREINHLPVDATMVLERTLAGIETTLDALGARVTYEALPTIKADPTQLSLLFQNLISNGIKFHGEAAPRVHVSAERAGRMWRFTVRDNGIGIKEVYQDRIFEVFRRLHSRSQYPGTGIGLAICKKIIERHGGRIWVESEVGQGATFYFTIPA